MIIEYNCDIPLQGRPNPVSATAIIGTDHAGEPGLVSITFYGPAGLTRVNKGARFRRAWLFLTNSREHWDDICAQLAEAGREYERTRALMQMIRRTLFVGEFRGEPLSEVEIDRANLALMSLRTRLAMLGVAA